MKKLVYYVLGILLLASSVVPAQAAELSDGQLKRSIVRNFADRFMDDGRDIEAERTIYFERRSDEIGRRARSTLAKHAEYFVAHDNLLMILAGYADDRGTTDFNFKLSQRRAEAVKEVMISLGVDPNRIRVLSFGEEHPAITDQSEDAQSRNRRVEILYMDTM